MMDRGKFHRRRQFLLGPEPVEHSGWNITNIDGVTLVSSHPDLKTTVITASEGSAITLGYMIDPSMPNLTELEIAEQIIRTLKSEQDVIEGIRKLCGRFVLIVKFRENLWLFHDAVALGQVNYCVDRTNRIWCASDATMLANRIGFQFDKDVLAFRASGAWNGKLDEFWLPNDRTPFREVRNLLPNHYLDLRRARTKRYWPVEGCIGALSVDDSVSACATILQNSIQAAVTRFDLRMGMSAGGDSRKTLAASKRVARRIYYFSHTPTQLSMRVNDVAIPSRLLPKLGLKHHYLPTLPMTAEFREIYNSSITWPREKRGDIAFTLLKAFGSEACVINSNISEVAQCLNWLPRTRLDGEGLAILSGLNHPFAVSQLQEWISGALPACKAARMNILDLFFLEQRMGRWATQAFLEYDIAHETFNPYNNRYLHEAMLSISERRRKNRRWEVTIKHIEHMWPEVLREPINPPDRLRDALQQFIRRFFIHKLISPWCPLYEYLRYRKAVAQFRAQRTIVPGAQ
jgi:hypothetical protein